MIFFDVTKTGPAGHRSGLTRVSSRLREEIGAAAIEVTWTNGALHLAGARTRAMPRAGDWFFTSEVFSSSERPGFDAFIASRTCGLAAIFHDAIPLKHPHITWPQSVARHPAYLKLLAGFDHVWAVSQASREELLGFWRWQHVERTPPVEVIALGADFNSSPRATAKRPGLHPHRPLLLCLGIVEPRKNQGFLLEVCDELWREGLEFELHVVGRINPHFGRPIVARIQSLRRRHGARLHFHESAADSLVVQLYRSARAIVLPTLAEGCGLPLLESLWMGVPCVCSDLPVLRENSGSGGCATVAVNDRAAWKSALRRMLTDDAHHATLSAEATRRALPTWKDAADTIMSTLSAPRHAAH